MDSYFIYLFLSAIHGRYVATETKTFNCLYKKFFLCICSQKKRFKDFLWLSPGIQRKLQMNWFHFLIHRHKSSTMERIVEIPVCSLNRCTHFCLFTQQRNLHFIIEVFFSFYKYFFSYSNTPTYSPKINSSSSKLTFQSLLMRSRGILSREKSLIWANIDHIRCN